MCQPNPLTGTLLRPLSWPCCCFSWPDTSHSGSLEPAAGLLSSTLPTSPTTPRQSFLSAACLVTLVGSQPVLLTATRTRVASAPTASFRSSRSSSFGEVNACQRHHSPRGATSFS